MNRESILRWIIYIGAGLLTLTPLVVANGMFFPYITGKAFYFRIIVEVMFGAWLILALYEPRVRPRFSWVGASVLGLLVIALVASVFGVNPGDSIWSNFERMMGWITLLHVAGLLCVLGHTLKPSHWRRLFYVSLGVSFIVGLFGFGQIGDTARIDGTLGNPIYLAVYGLFHALMAGYFLLRRLKRRLQQSLSWYGDWRLWLFGLVGIFNFLVMYYTKTRGALLGLLVGLFVAVVLVAILEKRRVWLRRTAAGLTALAVLLVGGFFVFQDSNFVQQQPVLERFANISLEEGTSGARLDVWALGLEGYADRPILGWGPGNFNYVFNSYYSPELFDQELWFDRAHNVVLEWLVAAGPLGALAYLSLFAAAIYLIWRDPRRETAEEFSLLEKSLLTGLVVAYLVQNLFVFDHLVSYLVLTLLLGWLHTRATHLPHPNLLTRLKNKLFGKDHVLPSAGRAWLSAAVAVGTVALVAVWNYPGYAQARTLIDAIRHESSNPPAALEYYQEAIAYDAMGTQEAREQLAKTAAEMAQSEGVSSAVAQEYLAVASREMEKQIAADPQDLRHNVFYGQALMAHDQHEAALTQFERANELAAGQKQAILFDIGQAQFDTGNEAAALETYRQAYELDTSFDEPAIRYASAAVLTDNAARAREILNEHFGTTTVDSQILVNAYGQIGDYASVVPIFEKRLRDNPNSPQAYANLAFMQAEAGQTTAAIQTLGEAIDRFPQIAEQASEMIRKIRAGESLSP